MKWTSLPRRTPRWITRHPVLLAEWLVACNAVRRAMTHRRRWWIAAIVALFAATAVAIAGPFATHAASAVNLLYEYWVALLVASAMYAAVTVARRRRVSKREFAASWLVAAPIGHLSESASHATRSLVPLALQSVGVVTVIVVLARLSNAPDPVTTKIVACIVAGVSCGAAIGCWLLRARDTDHAAGSRYVFRARTNVQPRPSDAALSTWPLAQLMAWGRPENTRVLLLAALFAVQGGSSAVHGLAVVASWFAASYLGGLLSASVRAMNEAAAWLRSTPLPFFQFAWSISRRALIHQAIGAAVAAGLLVAIGSTWTMALYLTGLWLIIVVVASTATLAECYRGTSSTAAITLSLAVLAAIESRARGWSIPCATVMTAWHLRRGAKAWR
jgi:hypothetical protein